MDYCVNNGLISIHAPAKGATKVFLEKDGDRRISIHAPAKGATVAHRAYPPMLSFQSTLPRRERPSNKILSVKLYGFQSTLPRRERLTTSEQSLATSGISIHAPAKGATDLVLDLSRSIFISIHAPAKGATEEKGFIPLRDMEFQSTLPRRERHPPFLALSTMTRFQSTLPRRERLPFGETGKGILNFNPRSREGSDLSSIHRQSRSR